MERRSTNDLRRILLAVTETSSVDPGFGDAVAEHLAETRVELVSNIRQ